MTTNTIAERRSSHRRRRCGDAFGLAWPASILTCSFTVLASLPQWVSSQPKKTSVTAPSLRRGDLTVPVLAADPSLLRRRFLAAPARPVARYFLEAMQGPAGPRRGLFWLAPWRPGAGQRHPSRTRPDPPAFSASAAPYSYYDGGWPLRDRRNNTCGPRREPSQHRSSRATCPHYETPLRLMQSRVLT